MLNILRSSKETPSENWEINIKNSKASGFDFSRFCNTDKVSLFVSETETYLMLF